MPSQTTPELVLHLRQLATNSSCPVTASAAQRLQDAESAHEALSQNIRNLFVLAKSQTCEGHCSSRSAMSAFVMTNPEVFFTPHAEAN